MSWNLLVNREDLSDTTLVEVDPPEPANGQAVLRVDRVGMTANNVTYAVLGEAMHYWDFFPVEPLDGTPQGRVPLWGFAEVERSAVPEVSEGTRVFGYLPTSSHLVVEPARIDRHGFRDASAHRDRLPAPYNGLTTTSADPAYDAALEDLQILYRPLFMTSFMLADFLTDNSLFGADTVVITSASSKTAYGTAFLLDGVRRVGLTSRANREFCSGLGCYDVVHTYDEIDDLEQRPSVLVDVAGDATIRRRVHESVVPVHSAAVGVSHHEEAQGLNMTEDLPGAQPSFFFAPDQMRKRRQDWGARGIEEKHAEAWSRFAPVVTDWVDITVSDGPEGLRSAWLETLAGSVAPRTGHVIAL